MTADIIKIVIDKFLIALIVLAISTYATNTIESLKNARSFNSQLDIMRANKIGDTWESVYSLEDKYANYLQLITTDYDKENNIDAALIAHADDHIKRLTQQYNGAPPADQIASINAYKDKITKAFDDFVQTIGDAGRKFQTDLQATSALIARNRFWLGDEQAKALNDYITLFMFQGGSTDPKEAARIQAEHASEISKKRQTIQTMRDTLLSGK